MSVGEAANQTERERGHRAGPPGCLVSAGNLDLNKQNKQKT